MKICPTCKMEFESGKFCHNCGISLVEKIEEFICPNCGAKYPTKAKFCLECGTKLCDDTNITEINTTTTNAESHKSLKQPSSKNEVLTFKFQINGPKRSYLQLRIINNTSWNNFSCKTYKLREDTNGNLSPELSSECSYYLKEYGDHEFCKADVHRNEWIAISLPEDMTDISFFISYRNTFLIDGVDITLTEKNDL